MSALWAGVRRLGIHAFDHVQDVIVTVEHGVEVVEWDGRLAPAGILALVRFENFNWES